MNEKLKSLIEEIIYDDERYFLARALIKNLSPTPLNAHFMKPGMFEQLKKNIKKDGYLSSIPLCWFDEENGKLIIISGNHRVMAATQSGLKEIVVQIVKQVGYKEAISKQLSQNSIFGEDDPQLLKQLYDELEEIDLAEYAYVNLDIDSGTSPAINIQDFNYYEVSLLFLPHEIDDIRKTISMMEMTLSDQSKEIWTVNLRDHKRWINILSKMRSKSKIKNLTTVFKLMLELVDRSLKNK